MNLLKYALLLFTTSVFITVNTYSQEPAGSVCLKNNICSYRLCDTCAVPYPNTSKKSGVNYGKYLTATNHYPGDVKYKDENDKCKHSTLSNYAVCNTDSTGILHYDVYFPTGYDYQKCPLPAIFYIHGGGFSDCSPIGNNSDIGVAFAQRGFVFYNIEYRAGRRVSPSNTFPYTTVQQELAPYRASQDFRGAIRSAIQRQRDQPSLPVEQRDPFQIDTNYIFVGGTSAGSITALNAAYYPRQSMIDSISPHSGSVTISQALGPINADYYYGTPDIDYNSKIKGIFDQWGSVTLPPNFDSTNAKDFFGNIRIPVICFHGQQDPVVPIYITPINFAPVSSDPTIKDSFNIERTCLITNSFRTNGALTSQPDLNTYGSISFFNNILQPLGIPSEIYVDLQMMHGLDCYPYNPPACKDAVFNSDFGTGYSTPDSVNLYMVGRAATLFQNIIGGYAQTRQNDNTTHKVFVECRNNRVKCNLANNDAGCTNNDLP